MTSIFSFHGEPFAVGTTKLTTPKHVDNDHLFQVKCSFAEWTKFQQNNNLVINPEPNDHAFCIEGMDEISKILVTVPSTSSNVEMGLTCGSFAHTPDKYSHLVKYSWDELLALGTVFDNGTLTFDLLALSAHKFPVTLLIYHRLGIFISDMSESMSITIVGNKSDKLDTATESSTSAMYFPGFEMERNRILSFDVGTWTCVTTNPAHGLTDILLCPANPENFEITSIDIKIGTPNDFLELHDHVGFTFDPLCKGWKIPFIPSNKIGFYGISWNFIKVQIFLCIRYKSADGSTLTANVFHINNNGIRFSEGLMGRMIA